MNANINKTNQKRIVIIGGGFGGFKLARELSKADYQIVLIDKNNYHQFQPLLYQVATSGLEPSAISFPFRKIFQKTKNIHIRIAEVTQIIADKNQINTNIGVINYDYLVIAIGTDTNYFGNSKLMEKAMPMKSVAEALILRNTILQNYENALTTEDIDARKGLLNIVVVGAGPTGVEVSGALAEMKKYVLPKEYPELDFKKMHVHLLEGAPRVLNTMSESASNKAKKYLKKLGVKISLNTQVKDYDGKNVYLADGSMIRANTLVWAAGVIGNKIEGLNADSISKANRIKVDRYNKVEGYSNIFAVGDIALMEEEKFPKGHPQMAQVAIQQGNLLAKNLKNILLNKPLKPFTYKDKGAMATVGRNKAVADLPYFKLYGFFAWIVWMFVHLMSIVGVKNRLFVFINWAWNYVTYDQSLRLIIKQKSKNKTSLEKHFLENTIGVFKNYKTLAEKTFSQLKNDEDFHYQTDSESNSIAVIIKHLSGNMISRWTNFLTTDGEKLTRNRDFEFVDDHQTREQLMESWNKGWKVFLDTLNSLNEDDLMKTITIRAEKLTVTQALNRQTAHYAYHIGQIVFLAKQIKNTEWKSLSIPKNKSAEFSKGFYQETIK